MTLTPAYGRDYESKAEVLKDFDDNKDFLAHEPGSSGYTSKTDLIKLGYKTVNIRYAKLRKVIVVKVT